MGCNPVVPHGDGVRLPLETSLGVSRLLYMIIQEFQYILCAGNQTSGELYET